MPLSPLEIALACIAIFAGSFVQGSIGFGMALAAGPILVLLDPTLVPAPLLTAGVAVTSVVAVRERRGLDLTALRYGLPGLIAGSIAGATVLVSAPSDRCLLYTSPSPRD